MATVKSAFIDDGYTEDFVIPAGEFWPEVKGKFRPLAAPQWAEFLTKAAKANEVGDLTQSTAAQIEVLAAAVKAWDLLSPGGQLVAISTASFGKLRKQFLEALFSATLSSGMKLAASAEGN